MKKILASMLLMSLMTTSCGKSGGGSSSEESSQKEAANETSDEGTTPTSSTLPSLALRFDTNVEMLNSTSAQEDKYNEAVEIVKKVVATEAFRKKILNFTYKGSKQFADNGGKTNAQIYQSILDAAERLQPIKNNILDLGVKFYYQNSSVVGYTMASITYINVNTKFFNQYDPNEVAGNLFHEWLHKLGYSHDSSATAKRPYSVPYAIGYMVRELGKSFL